MNEEIYLVVDIKNFQKTKEFLIYSPEMSDKMQKISLTLFDLFNN